MPITTLFLDAGGVIVVPNWHRVSSALAAHGVGVSAEALERADPVARRDLDLGLAKRANDQQRGWLYFDLMLTYAGVALSESTQAALADLQAYHADQNLWEKIPDGVPEALDAFRALGLKLVVVSNANGRARFLLERLGLANRLEMVLDSHEEGVEKPDPRFFQIAIERSGASPESTMHVGDLYHVDVEGARAAGLRAMLLDPLDLYADFDCERVRSLNELAEKIEAEQG
jgi:HAD superfamily hydrolase (TIGR01549 family)